MVGTVGARVTPVAVLLCTVTLIESLAQVVGAVPAVAIDGSPHSKQ